MVDVSAQDQCIVTQRSSYTLTATGGALANGTTDVRFHCRCQLDGGISLNARWFYPIGTRLNTLENTAANIFSYFVIENGGREAVLVIPTFTESSAGTYMCARNNPPTPPPPNANVTLTICKLVI